MDDKKDRIIVEVGGCKSEEDLEVVLRLPIPIRIVELETTKTGRFLGMFAIKRSMLVCVADIKDVRD